MASRLQSHSALLALISLSITIGAYALARPGGVADMAKTSREERSGTDRAEPAASLVVAAPVPLDEAGDDFEQIDTTELDLPVDGTNGSDGGGSVSEDIPGNTTINANGEMVRPGPPVMRDNAIAGDDDVSGAE